MKHCIQHLVRFLGFALLATSLHAGNFEAGLEAYHNSEYVEATEAFKAELLNNESAALRHNLALSYYQAKQPAEAAWQLERAIQLSPLNQSYLYKMNALRQQLGLYDAPGSWWERGSHILSANAWLSILAVSFWALIAYVLIPRFGGFNRPIGLKLLAGLSTACIVLSAGALGVRYWERTSGIIISNEAATVRHAPASAAPETGIARSGERARIIDEHGDFLRIQTEADIVGWIAKDAFRAL